MDADVGRRTVSLSSLNLPPLSHPNGSPVRVLVVGEFKQGKFVRLNAQGQVVWLEACERTYIEEMGGMNLMFVQGSGDTARIVTPELSGSLLPGITRDSILQVAKDLGYGTEERRITVDQWRDGVASGEITETLACGTAAVITPVGKVLSNSGEFTIGGNEAGDVSIKLRKQLRGADRAVDVGRVAVGDRGERTRRRGIDGLEGAARGRPHPLAADQHRTVGGDEIANALMQGGVGNDGGHVASWSAWCRR